MISTEKIITDEKVLPPIINLISVALPHEKAFLALGLARGFCLLNYKTLLIDFDFQFPLISLLLEKHGFTIQDPTIAQFYTNPDHVLRKHEINDISISISVNEDPKQYITVLPINPTPALAKKIDFTENKVLKKTTRNLRKMFREVQEEGLYDVIIINGQDGITQDTENAMQIATVNFCLAKNRSEDLSFVKRVERHLSNLNPYYRINGVILTEYEQYANSQALQQSLTRLEGELKIPVISVIQNMSLFLEPFPFKPGSWKLDQYFMDLCGQLFDEILSPRFVELERPLVFYSLFLIDSSGIPMYVYNFNQNNQEQLLASAGLSAIISGITSLIGELVKRTQKMNYIELSRIKIFVVEEKIAQKKTVRSVLLVSKYEDTLAKNLQRFTSEVLDKYAEEIKGFQGEKLRLEGIDQYIQRYFLNPYNTV